MKGGAHYDHNFLLCKYKTKFNVFSVPELVNTGLHANFVGLIWFSLITTAIICRSKHLSMVKYYDPAFQKVGNQTLCQLANF